MLVPFKYGHFNSKRSNVKLLPPSDILPTFVLLHSGYLQGYERVRGKVKVITPGSHLHALISYKMPLVGCLGSELTDNHFGQVNSTDICVTPNTFLEIPTVSNLNIKFYRPQ